MSGRLIPANAHRAAARAGIRTSAQSLASFIPIGFITLVLTEEWITAALLGAAGALLTSLLAGTAAYLDTLAKGIPEDYAPAGITPRRAAPE